MAQINESKNKTTGRKPYVNTVKCLNNEVGHRYEHELRVSVNVPGVDPFSGALRGTLSKTYILELVCQEYNCGSRIALYSKTVSMEENVSLAQMLQEYQAELAAKYYAEQQAKENPQNIGGR